MFQLMSSRRFAPLFWTQFFSAFSDNFLKTAMVFVILATVAGDAGETMVTAAGGLFIAPFFLLSALGGEWADRYDKAFLIRRLKFAELVASLVAVSGFALHSLPLLFAALIAYGIIAALFGPVKYGILPDHLAQEELPTGNALVEGATFVAIVGGAMLAGFAADGGADPSRLGILVGALSLVCWLCSLAIPAARPADPTLTVHANVLGSTWTLLKQLKGERRLWLLGIYMGWFWFVGAVVMSLLPSFVKNGLGGSEAVVTTYLAVFAIAIALGSGLAAWMAAGRVILLPAVIGTLGMALFAVDLSFAAAAATPTDFALGIGAFFAEPHAWRIGFDLFGLAVSGGLLIVPCFSALQIWADPHVRSRMIGATNVLGAGFMIASAVALGALQASGFSTAGIFAALALGNLLAAAYMIRTLPTSLFRDFLSIVYRAVFRLEVKGAENIAKAGPNAIIALNHVSFLDAGLALAIMHRDPVFAIDHTIAKRWWVRPFLKLTRAMPLDPTRPMATRTLINAVRSGETLIIFPEGRLTVTGALMKVYDGAGLIADKSEAMVVPVKIDGLEKTPFSRLGAHQVRRKWFPKVTVTVLEPVRLTVDPALKGKARRQAAGTALYQIMSDLIFRTFDRDRTVFQAIAAAAAEHGKARVALQDPVTGDLSYKRLLVGAEVLGRRLAAFTRTGEAVGVMLPNANGAAVTTLALMSAGRVPAMINFTAGAANIAAACRAVEAKTILTSRAFVEKAKLDGLVREIAGNVTIVYLEDVRAGIGALDKLRGLLNAGKPIERRSPDDPAAILFTSGSEGTPKAVVLSSRNMLANAAQAAARIDFGRTDKVFNVLPMFHSFGLTVGFVLPLISGVPVYLYPSPLHYRIVPELVYSSNATILFGTDTFLNGYARTAHPYDFRSLRYILAGAEPVKESTRRTFMEKFGVRILEGYGVTETAPVLAINTPMYNRSGTVGRLMPGMTARLEPVSGVEEGGRLHVAGPNVMLGYMRAEKPGVLEPPAEGWHDTGDIVTIDADGFITIKGRAKRFAKVAGEMVSLAAVEALAADLWPGRASAVTTVPDERKGERLILVTDEPNATREAFQRFARERGATELMIPAELMIVGGVPVLGSGKVDHVGVGNLVRERRAAA